MVTFDQLNEVRCDGCEVMNYSSTKNILQECTSPSNETIIHFVDATINSIPTAIFDSFVSLKVLDASASQLSSIVNMHFEHLENLTQLDLSNNSIQIIPQRIFDKCNAIDVNLRQNQISSLDSFAFVGLTKLTNLDLSNNRITNLGEDVFRPLVNIKDLRLGFNHIGVIDAKLFAHNAKLQMLYLNNNLIAIIDSKAFEALKYLNALEIGNNVFAEINLMPMERLRTVNVMNSNLTALEIPNSLTNVHAFDNQIAHIKVSIDSNLTTLMVGKNRLTSLGDLIEHRKLQDLELSYNRITHLDLTTLTKMTQLKELLIYGIKVEKLDADFVLNHLPHLRIIELSPNLHDQNELSTFTARLNEKRIYVISEGGKVMNGNSKIIHDAVTPGPNAVVAEDVINVPATHIDSIGTKDNIESDSNRDSELIDRIQRLEQIIQSNDAHRANLQYKQNIDENLHTLRIMIITTICVFSLFVAFQIFIFVRNNYTRLRLQTNSMLSNGRARSHEPMLEEVL